MNWFKKKGGPSKLERRCKDLEAEIDARDRTIRVQQAEIDALSAIVARDRERIRSETAAYARAVAEGDK